MTRRELFISGIFRSLDERNLKFVLLRNHDDIFHANDIDLLVEPVDLSVVLRVAQDEAIRHGFQLVQEARFVNHSIVWWDGERDFVRLDIETALRWKIFEAASTTRILTSRIRRGDFWIPSPADEADCLRLQLACKGHNEDRYTLRLAELGQTPEPPAIARRRLVAKTLRNPRLWLKALRYLAADAIRFIRRATNPIGVLMTVVTARVFDAENLARLLSPIFPLGKRPASHERKAIQASLFHGGFACTIEAAKEGEDPSVFLRKAPVQGSTNRNFLAMTTAAGEYHLAHVASGFMVDASRDEPIDEVSFRFICKMLAKNHCAGTWPKGRSILLAGVDGAGKTTFARNLCVGAASGKRFSGCRYFHWIPDGSIQFPWPAFSEIERKQHQPSVILSYTRLLRNVLRAAISWNRIVKPLIAGGRLVILDRFVANYWLDPASVKYRGSGAILELSRRLLPKPDLLLTLDASALVLHSRKAELSIPQIREQQDLLARLPALCRARMDLDASIPPKELAAQALMAIEKL